MKTTKSVCVWYDRYCDEADHGWIVSVDEIDERGRAETTTTKWATPDEDEAVDHALKLGRKLGLPVYRNDEGVVPVLLQAIETE